MWYLGLILCLSCIAGCVTTPGSPQAGEEPVNAPSGQADDVGAAATVSGKAPVEHQVRRCPDRVEAEDRRPSVTVGVASDVPTRGKKKSRVVTNLECP